MHQTNWKPIVITKEKALHLLNLFAKATKENAHTILKVLNEFFSSSGLNMNAKKSKIYYSSNCDNQLNKQISSILKIKKVNKLGNYLGFPIQIILNPNTPWKNILVSKYLKQTTINPFIIPHKKTNSSFIWKWLLSWWNIIFMFCKWSIGDGKIVRFWSDPWASSWNVPLNNLLHGPFSTKDYGYYT